MKYLEKRFNNKNIFKKHKKNNEKLELKYKS